MRGWIYVISNKAMPGLVKVGYSSKDPKGRAQELDHTGTPHPYVVEYDALIDGELYQVERRIHQNLSPYSEGKEWFRCETEQAIIAIRQVAKDITILESFSRADREKAERLEYEKEFEVVMQQQKGRKEAEVIANEGEIIEKYRNLIEISFPKPKSLITFLLFLGVIFMAVLIAQFPRKLDWPWFIYALGGATIFTYVLRNYVIRKQKESEEYRSLIRKRDAELEAIRKSMGNVNSSKVQYDPNIQESNLDEDLT